MILKKKKKKKKNFLKKKKKKTIIYIKNRMNEISIVYIFDHIIKSD